MIVDCFMFFNELDLLEIRLHELDSVVDKFVLVESGMTFSGNRKPMIFEPHKARFAEFLPKIVHIQLDKLPGKRTWDKEQYQRDAIMKGLTSCTDDDLILISDVDEIPRASSVIEAAKLMKSKPFVPFRQLPYMYFLNGRWQHKWHGTVGCTYKTLKHDFCSSPEKARAFRRHGVPLFNAGWHFSFLGSVDDIILKLKSYSHQKTADQKVFDRDTIIARREVGLTFSQVGRWKDKRIVFVEIDDTFPKYVVDNQKRFSHLIKQINGGSL